MRLTNLQSLRNQKKLRKIRKKALTFQNAKKLLKGRQKVLIGFGEKSFTYENRYKGKDVQVC